MAAEELSGGYMGSLLRVDLGTRKFAIETLPEEMKQQYVGGTGLGAKVLYDEVPPGVEWSDPENRVILACGPFGGTCISGSGTFSVVFKGPMTDMAAATQANGFLGAFLKFCGFDGIILQGQAKELSYLHVHDGHAELRDARHLAGKDTYETEDLIKEELGYKKAQVSVYSIGPAGENLVRFAILVGDHGHVCGHNGLGAVLGAKRLKAIAVARGRRSVPVRDEAALSTAAEELLEVSRNWAGGTVHKWGTGGGFSSAALGGYLPVKNYTTNLFPQHEKLSGQYMRGHFELKPKRCWRCGVNHLHTVVVTEGPYAGYEGEEPDYECLAAWGSNIGQTDLGAVVMLTDLSDRLGVNATEASWVMSWIMECYEKGILTKGDLDEQEMTWGDVEAVRAMLCQIAYREGFGDILAEGVKRASEQVGGEASHLGVYVLKGSSPRAHDHRGRWSELLDTCFSNTGTIEATFGGAHPEVLGLPPEEDRFSPKEVALANARVNGWRQFEDCLGVCRFCSRQPQLVLDCTNAITGWRLTLPGAMTIGRRIVNQLRVFNFRHGLTAELEAPSARYGSTPIDGPVRSIGITPHWKTIAETYYEAMGWDKETGKPTPETLETLGLGDLIHEL